MPLSTIQSSTTLSHRNMLINGDLMIDQKNAAATQTGSGGTKPIDGWRQEQSNVGQLETKVERVTDAPANTGLIYSIRAKVKTPETSLDATEDLNLHIKCIEGHDCQKLMYGTANAKTTTLSFWVKSSIAGTFSARIYQEDGNDSISKPYTINSADTWEYKTISYPGNTLAAITDDSTCGLKIIFNISLGSNYYGGSNGDVWTANTPNLAGFGHVTNTHATTDESTFQLTGVQFEMGHVATPFEFRTFNEALARCQRYYYRINANGASDERGVGFTRSTSTVWIVYQFPCKMNHDPVLETSGNVTHYAINIRGGTSTCDTLPAMGSTGTTSSRVNWYVDTGEGLATGEAAGVRFANSTTFLAFEAEL